MSDTLYLIMDGRAITDTAAAQVICACESLREAKQSLRSEYKDMGFVIVKYDTMEVVYV